MTINPLKLGALMAASALFGAATLGALSGFQANTQPKFANVDIGKVFDGSSLAAANTETLRGASKARQDAFDFIAQNTVMDTKDAARYAELASKTVPLTPAEKTEMDRIHTAGETASRTQHDLSLKGTPTDDDKKALTTYGTNNQTNRGLLGQLQGAFRDQIQTMQEDLRDKTLDQVQTTIRRIGKQQGYTVVFSTASAPYASNDITQDCVSAMKK